MRFFTSPCFNVSIDYIDMGGFMDYYIGSCAVNFHMSDCFYFFASGELKHRYDPIRHALKNYEIGRTLGMLVQHSL